MSDMNRIRLMHDCKGKIQMFNKHIEGNKISEKRRFKLQILRWIYVGISEHRINLVKLDRVAKTYERIGLLPEGYQQADLFIRSRPTN